MSEQFIGVDVGGTFTDVYYVSADGTSSGSAKSPTTRPDPTVGILQALRHLDESPHFDWEAVSQITVGSTLALNAVIEGRGARAALITTAGFRDVLEIGRENRSELYNLDQPIPRVLIPRHLRFEVAERVFADGQIAEPLDLSHAGPQLLEELDAAGVEAIAICFINSYANAAHEVAVAQYLAVERPNLFVCTSGDVMRQYREYERTLVTCVNAYVGPVMVDYLKRLEGALQDVAPSATVRITDSAGGAVNIRAAGNRPVLTMMSGPASGVAGAAGAVDQDGGALVAMDMGGTSCDVTVIQGGKPDLKSTVTVADYRFALLAADVHSIGAGGGTAAWVDDGGLLRVGPRSTGSMPGPACYGHGGQDATITDAHLVLGHLIPDATLGGKIRLDYEAAFRVLSKNIADPLNLSVEEAAAGILRIADSSMQRAIEAITVRRGLDPRDFTLVAFGGAGPLHGTGIAQDLGIARTVIPRFAGELCAAGAVWAPERYEVSRTVLVETLAFGLRELHTVLSELTGDALALSGGANGRTLQPTVTFDMRFVGQTSTLPIVIAHPESLTARENAHTDFTARYREVFGYVLGEHPSEIENVRVSLTVVEDRSMRPAQSAAGQAQPERWRAHFGASGEMPCDLWTLSTTQSLPPVIEGPALVRSAGSTAVIHPGQTAVSDVSGALTVHTLVDRGSATRIENALAVSR